MYMLIQFTSNVRSNTSHTPVIVGGVSIQLLRERFLEAPLYQ
jgi:hypothetical protein